MADNKHALEYVSDIQDMIDLNDFMQDEKFGEALDLALKCIAKPDLPPATAKKAVVQLQAYSFYFKLQAQMYVNLKQGNNQKKNFYFTMSEQCAGLSMALRPMARETF